MKKMTTTIPTSTILSTNFTENTYVASDTEVSFTSPYNINPIAKWLEEHAKPLKTTNPTASLNDLKPLKDMVGSASIVGLGETTHGAHEVFTMKHRIVHYLVSEKGFTNLVLEEGWDRALKLDRYVLTGKGNPNQHLSPEFNTKEIVDLINWIQEYNADPKHKSKVRVIGMDIQSVSKNIYNNIIEYVRRNNPKLLPSLEEKIKDLIPVTKDINIFSGLTKEN
ncbi:erythromycin esterase family protein, partial [Bacillus wiedmannii]